MQWNGTAEFILVQLVNALCALEIIKGLLKNSSIEEKSIFVFPMELH